MEYFRILISNAIDRFKKDGFIGLIQGFIRHTRRGFELGSYQSARVDHEERFQIISDKLDGNEQNLLDIGCSEGILTAKFASRDLVSLGIETNNSIKTARYKHRDMHYLCFLQLHLTPNNIRSLPAFDVTLLLSVFHWWFDEYGREGAEEMLNVVFKNSGKLFIEMPAEHWPERNEGLPARDDSTTITQYYVDYLSACLNNGVIEYLGSTSYKGADQEYHLYLIQ